MTHANTATTSTMNRPLGWLQSRLHHLCFAFILGTALGYPFIPYTVPLMGFGVLMMVLNLLFVLQMQNQGQVKSMNAKF